jgi:hypothetical protein
MSNISEIVNTIKKLIDVRLEMIKEEIRVRISSFIARIAILVLMGIFALFLLLFISLSLAFYLSEVTRSPFLGFLYVAGIYLVILVILYFVRNSLQLQASLRSSLSRFVFFGEQKKKEEHE